jgi:hypothetical protein
MAALQRSEPISAPTLKNRMPPMTAVAKHLLGRLFVTDNDLLVVLMFSVSGLLLSVCLTLATGSVPPTG